MPPRPPSDRFPNRIWTRLRRVKFAEPSTPERDLSSTDSRLIPEGLGAAQGNFAEHRQAIADLALNHMRETLRDYRSTSPGVRLIDAGYAFLRDIVTVERASGLSPSRLSDSSTTGAVIWDARNTASSAIALGDLLTDSIRVPSDPLHASYVRSALAKSELVDGYRNLLEHLILLQHSLATLEHEIMAHEPPYRDQSVVRSATREIPPG
jgi:hypothetical protein